MMATPYQRGQGWRKDGPCVAGRLMARPLFFMSLEPYPGLALSGWPLPSFHKFRLQMARKALILHQSGRAHGLVKAGPDAGIEDRGLRFAACRGHGVGRRGGSAEGAAGGQAPCGASRNATTRPRATGAPPGIGARTDSVTPSTVRWWGAQRHAARSRRSRRGRF